MANETLDQVIGWLQQNPLNRFEIYDISNNRTITRCISYEDITEKHSAPKDYFKSLLAKGAKSIQIVKKRKNGSSYMRKCNHGLNFALSSGAENNVAASGQSNNGAATQQPSPQPVAGYGLNAPGGMGLSFPEIMDMRTNAVRYQETKEELATVKTANKELEKENKRLERENWELQKGKDNEPTALDKLLDSFSKNPVQMIQAFSAIKGSPSPALNAPAAPSKSQLSEVKAMVVELISTNKEVTDEAATAVYHLLVQMVSGNEEFYNSYVQLLKDSNIIE